MNPAEHESRQNWIPPKVNLAENESRWIWIPPDLNPAKTESRHISILPEMNSTRKNPTRIETHHLKTPLKAFNSHFPGLSTEDVEVVAEVVTPCMIKRCRAWPLGCGRSPGCGMSSGEVCYS